MARAELCRLATIASATLVLACGAGSHPEPPDGSQERDSGVDAAIDGSVDGGTSYDCQAACAGASPICTGLLPDGQPSTPCDVNCGYFAEAASCPLGEGLRLLECFETNPGACEDPTGASGCAYEWTCYRYCTDPASAVWCRPQP